MIADNLSKIPLFGNLPPAMLKDIASCLISTKLNMNDVLFYKEDIGDCLLLLKIGEVKISVLQQNL